MPTMVRREALKRQSLRSRAMFAWTLALALAGCQTPHGPAFEPTTPSRPQPEAPEPQAPMPQAPALPEPAAQPQTLPLPAPEATEAAPAGPPSAPVAPPAAGAGSLKAADWRALPGWSTDDLSEAWSPFLASCMALKSRPEWQKPCLAASQVARHDPDSLRRFFQEQFRPYRVINADGSDSGLVTGYFEPLLHGSRTRSERYRFPIYGVPDDLLDIELDSLFPELKGQRVRGRVEGHRVVPYYTRGEIDNGNGAFQGHPLLWVDDAVELFFLHVQGSGRVQLPDGSIVRVGYADHNGHPYRSIGRLLVDRGEMPLSKASMQGIKAWARENPGKLPALLAENPAYVFFREMPEDAGGPLGSLNVPLTARRSIAIDPATVPLGAPVFLATTWPNTAVPLNRLMLAQDTGSAIKGAVRADFFWGFGDEASRLAGRMKQSGRMWVLLPKDYALLSR